MNLRYKFVLIWQTRLSAPMLKTAYPNRCHPPRSRWANLLCRQQWHHHLQELQQQPRQVASSLYQALVCSMVRQHQRETRRLRYRHLASQPHKVSFETSSLVMRCICKWPRAITRGCKEKVLFLLASPTKWEICKITKESGLKKSNLKEKRINLYLIWYFALLIHWQY